jgi:hypothetical protein
MVAKMPCLAMFRVVMFFRYISRIINVLYGDMQWESCRSLRDEMAAHMIRLTETQEIAPYPWVHPDEER